MGQAAEVGAGCPCTGLNLEGNNCAVVVLDDQVDLRAVAGLPDPCGPGRAVRRSNPDLPGTDITKIHDKIADIMDDRIDEYGSGQDEDVIADVFDRHVHAAATAGNIDFFLLVDVADPSLVLGALQYQIGHMSRTGRPNYDFPDALHRSDCPQFASRVAGRLRQLAHQG